MRTKRFWNPVASLAIGGVSLFGALAAHAVYNPPIHMMNGVEYMSGGVSSDEAELMETVAPRWPATFEFADQGRKAGGFRRRGRGDGAECVRRDGVEPRRIRWPVPGRAS